VRVTRSNPPTLAPRSGGEGGPDAHLGAPRYRRGRPKRASDVPATEPTPPTAPGATDARICAGCGVTNHPDRLLCRSCGVDLDAPAADVTVAAETRATGAVWSGSPSGARLARSWALALFAIGAVIAVVLGVLVVAEVGPFARAVDIPAAAFAAADYAADPEILVLSDIASLTTREDEGGRSFDPTQLVDGDPTTAWHGSIADLPAGLDEKIDLVLGQPAWVTALVLDNGDQATADDYAAVGRPQRVQLIFDGDVVVPVTLLDQGLEPQIVELDEPLLTTAVRIEVLATVPGTERDDPALSRVELRGHPAVEADRQLAAERAEIRPAAGPIVEPA
jgi:hypothetical protein